MQPNKNNKNVTGIRNPTKFIIKIILIYGTVIILILLLRQVSATKATEEAPITVSFCEIMPNPEGTDTKNNEYVKLKNHTADTIDLTGWKICNISQDCYPLQESLPAESCNKIYRASFVFTLHNDKEAISLLDGNNNLVDKITTDTAPSGKAWQCFGGYCEWGGPRESCDYSFLIPEQTPGPEDNLNVNENSSYANENDNNNSPAESEKANNNINNSVGLEKTSSYPINDKKDFSRIRKILRKEKIISISVDIKGTVAIPRGLMGKTYFYLFFENELIKIHVYSSCQNSPDCLRDIEPGQGKKLDIQSAVLKVVDSRFEIYLDKFTRVEEKGYKKLKKARIANKNKNLGTGADLPQKIGQKVEISGNITAKKGDYFFVEDGRSSSIVSVYVPKMLQNAFAKKLDPIPLGYFPFYSATIPSKSWLGGLLEASGIVETAGQEYRVIAYELKKLQLNNNLSKEKTEEKAKEKPDVGSGLRPEPENSSNFGSSHPPSPEASDGQGRLEPTKIVPDMKKVEQSENNQKIDKKNLEKILVQSLSWQSLWGIFLSKLTVKISSFRQYF